MGEIEAIDTPGEEIIQVLRLDSDDATAYRRKWLGILRSVANTDERLFRELIGYPRDLPDLSSKRPEGGNDRLSGLAEGAHQLKRLGCLPEWY
jgi:hypothetical protein